MRQINRSPRLDRYGGEFMTLTSGLFSSNTDEWSTPSELFNQLNEEFNFTLDVCATPDNAKCKEYFTKEQDGLSQKWHGTVWMNPPYGRAIAKWIEKAHEYGTTGGTAVALIPARTDTRYWHDFVMDATEIRFIKAVSGSGTRMQAHLSLLRSLCSVRRGIRGYRTIS